MCSFSLKYAFTLTNKCMQPLIIIPIIGVAIVETTIPPSAKARAIARIPEPLIRKKFFKYILKSLRNLF
jgi:hypothetical protein